MSEQINIDSPFPLIISTVDACIFDDIGKPKQILLGRKKHDPNLKWRFIGGFADVSSFDDEEDVIREILEETQIDVKNVGVVYLGGVPIEDKRYKDTPHQIRTRVFLTEADPLGKMQASDDIDILSWFGMEVLSSLEDILIDEHKIVWNLVKKRWGHILVDSLAISKEEFANIS